MPRLIKVALCAIVSTCLPFASASAANTIWVAAKNNTFVIDAVLGQNAPFAANVPLQIAASSDDSVWALYRDRVDKRDRSGALLASIPLSPLTVSSADFLALDANSKTIWIADSGASRIVQLNAQGQLLKSWNLPGNIRALALGLDDTVWALGNKRLWQFRWDGTTLRDLDLHAVTHAEPKMLAVDSLRGGVWFGGEKQFVRLDGDNILATPANLALSAKADFIAPDVRTGELWIAMGATLAAYDNHAALVRTIDLSARGVKSVAGMAFDPVSRALWVLHDSKLRRVDINAQNDKVFELGATLQVMGTAAFDFSATGTVVSPTEGLVTNNALLPVSVQFGANCNGMSCEFVNASFANYRLVLDANGTSVAGSPVFDPTTGIGKITPNNRWTEGRNVLTARVTDFFGHIATLPTRSFTVDTMPPSILNLLPASPALTNASPLRVSGKVSELATVKINGQATVVQADLSFAGSIALNEGANAIIVEAQDLAGNTAASTFPVTLDTIPPSFVALSPSSGSLTSQSSVIVAGTLSEDATLTINGAVATVASDKTFTATVPVTEGTNSVVLRATDRAGNVTTKTLSVTRDTAPPKLLSLTPGAGTVLANPAVRIAGAFDDATTVTLTGAASTQTAMSANFAFDVILQTGANSFTLAARDAAGNASTQTVSLTLAVTGDPVDAPYMAAWDGMNNALKAGNVSQALTYLTSGAQVKYRPIFEALIGDMPAIIASYSKPSRGHLSEDTAEYAIMRYVETEKDYEVFFIYFVKLADGTSLIETM